MKSTVPESINFIYIVPVQSVMKVPVCRLNVNNFVLVVFASATSNEVLYQGTRKYVIGSFEKIVHVTCPHENILSRYIYMFYMKGKYDQLIKCKLWDLRKLTSFVLI